MRKKTKGTVAAVMEFGVRITRARARTLAMSATATTTTTSSTNKKRKAVINSDEAQTSSLPHRRRRFGILRNSVENVQNSHHSRCSSNGSSELVDDGFGIRSVTDPHSESLPYESSTCLNCSKRRHISTQSPSSSRREKMEEQELKEKSASRSGSSNRSRDEKRTPSPLKEEIDEFFSRAEKEEQKRFAEKYNYDIKKDVPLEGRYDWVRLKP